MIVDAVRALHVQAREQGLRSPWRASLLLPRQYEATVTAVVDNLCRYPLARLQRPPGYREGQDYERLLYDDRVFGGRRRVVLELHDGRGEQLLALSGLLMPVLLAEWTQQVASLNGLPSEDLRTHLFGRERQDLGPVRDALRAFQGGRCQYCRVNLKTGGQVDHVVPWSLHPQDAIENLVLAHDRCNAAKSAYLLDVEPLAAWATRDLSELQSAAAGIGWTSSAHTVFSLARAAYSHSGGALLWQPFVVRAPLVSDLEERILPLLRAA